MITKEEYAEFIDIDDIINFQNLIRFLDEQHVKIDQASWIDNKTFSVLVIDNFGIIGNGGYYYITLVTGVEIYTKIKCNSIDKISRIFEQFR